MFWGGTKSACGNTAKRPPGMAFEWLQIRPTSESSVKPLPPASCVFRKEGGGGCAATGCAPKRDPNVSSSTSADLRLEIVRNRQASRLRVSLQVRKWSCGGRIEV